MKFILTSFFVWRIYIQLVAYLAAKILPLKTDFLAVKQPVFATAPWIWEWLNFDGEYYLTIAQDGYRHLTYFYFPLYPYLVKTLSSIFGNSSLTIATTGLIVSHLSLLLALVGIWKLVRLDYSEKIARVSIITILAFPTSFFFAGFYTESLFLALVVWSFYLARRKIWYLAGVFGAFSTATRIVGLALIPALLVEVWVQNKGDRAIVWKKIFSILFIPVGLIVYMYFLKLKVGDPLEFLHSIGVFGEQRSASFVLLPQVFYRYIFKILPNIKYDYLPIVFTTWMEFIVAVGFVAIGVLAILGGLGKRKKLGGVKLEKFPLSYGVYIWAGFIIPTLSGSFSSLPRYVLVLFPSFIIMSIYLSKAPKPIQIAFFGLLFIGLTVATSLFLRGYWVA